MTRPPTETEHHDIERVLFAYCDLVDRAHVDELVDLFTDDAVIDYGYDRLITGRDQIRSLFHDRLGRYQGTSHHASNVTIEMGGETTATASSAVYAWHRLPNGDTAEVWGRYEDDLVYDGSAWRLARRTIRAAGWQGFDVPEGLPGPFEPIERGV